MNAKIRIKMGALEVEYEGDEEYIKEGLLSTVDALMQLKRNNLKSLDTETGPDDQGNGGLHDAKIPRMTTSSLATKLNVATGPELAMAAAAHLSIIEGKEEFTRKDLTKTMRSAKGFYKTSYTDNLSTTLTSLVKKGDLLEVKTDTYAIDKSKRERLEAKLAEK